MKKYIFLIMFLFIPCTDARASIFPPNCICEITAKIISARQEPVAKNKYQTEDLTSVVLDIEIIKVGSMLREGMVPEMTCKQYQVGQKITLTVVKERDFFDKDLVIKPGMIIKGDMEYSGDENGPWYNFNNIVDVKGRK